MIDVRQLHLEKSKRSIVISDIHANLELFKNLLKKVNFTKEDYLFINGDLCEKGANSLEVVAYVKSLSEQNSNVFVTKGNCDVVYQYVFNGSEGIKAYMNTRKHSILNEMLIKHGKSLNDFSDLKELEVYYRQHFHSEIEWIQSLPIAYETEDFIVVHAGLENRADWQQTEEKTALYVQSFYEQGHKAEKIVIVGHWPAVNYRAIEVSSHNPLIDLEKKIIALDGGNQIKKEGQLNALIIENGIYSYTYVDELSRHIIVQKEYKDITQRVGTITYPNYGIEVIKEAEYFTLCTNVNLRIEQWIKNEYIVVEEQTTNCKAELSTTFLSVKQGEKVWIVDQECAGYMLVKRENGEVGWIPKECVESLC